MKNIKNWPVKMVPVDEIAVAYNVRTEANEKDVADLMADIAAHGLKDYPQAWLPDGKTVTLLKGHRRRQAILRLRESDPQRFAELFGDGVPVAIRTDVTTLQEALTVVVDQGLAKGLVHRYEAQKTINALAQAGYTQEAMAVTASGVLDQLYPIKGETGKTINALKAKIANMELPLSEREQAEADLRTAIGKYRRGIIQKLLAAYHSPTIVMAALAADAGDSVPEEFKGVYLPVLSPGDVVNLREAHKKDLEDAAQTDVSKSRPGKNFLAKWNSIVERSKKVRDAANSGEAAPSRPKAKSGQVMQQEAAEFISLGFRGLASYHAGLASAPTREFLNDLDRGYHTADICRDKLPQLWKQVEAEVLAWIKAENAKTYAAQQDDGE